jgi:hypothetical protein
MSERISSPISSIAIVVGLLVPGIAVGLRANSARADDCLIEPNSPAPEGSHWYYHVDWKKQRKCWYLRAPDRPAQEAAAGQAMSDAAPAAHTIPLEQAATASADAPIPISPSDILQPSPHIKMLAAKARRAYSAATGEPVQQNVEEEGTLSSLQASPMSQISAPAEPVSAADTASSTRSVAAIKAQAPAPTDAPTETVQSAADASTPDNAESTAQDNVSATKAVTAFLTPTTPAEMFPIFALGLLIAGFLFRMAIKIAAARNRRRIRRIIPTATDYSPPRPFQRVDEAPDNTGGEDRAFDIADEIRKRVDMLEELRRDLDRLLRSPKLASPHS